MASVPSTHLIIFIAAVIMSAGIGGVIVDSAERYGDSLQSSQSSEAAELETEIAIINDPEKPAASYDEVTDEMTLYVKNVGDRILPSDPDDVTVLVDGTAQPIDSVTVHGEDRWRPGVVVELTLTVELPSNSQTRVIVSVTGDEDRYEFRTT